MRHRDDDHASSTLRRDASRAAKKRYAAGKAFGRIRYFEQQRGFAPTQHRQGVVQPRVRATKAYLDALEARAARGAARANDPGQPVWLPLGPALIPRGQTYGSGAGSRPSVSGRCSGVLVDANDSACLTLASAGGGLWRSTDAGASWRPLTDFMPTLSMGAIAAAPGAPDVVYAGTGEGNDLSPQALGLLRSGDGGATWQHVRCAALVGRATYDIAVDPGDPRHVFVATTAGLFESRDGGASCVRRLRGACWSVSIDPRGAHRVLAATTGGLKGSVDGGRRWTEIALPGVGTTSRFRRMAVRHARSEPVVYVAAAGAGATAHLWRRAGTNARFTSEPVPDALTHREALAQAWYDWCLGIAPDNANVVYWGVIGLYRGSRSARGEWRWSDIASRAVGDSIHPDLHDVAFDPNDPRVVYACSDGGLFRSPDRGKSWVALNRGLAITEFEFLAQLETDAEFLVGGTQDNGTLGRAGRRRWRQIALGDGGACGADAGSGACYHSYYGMGLERGAIGALAPDAWKNVSPPTPHGYASAFYPPLAVCGRLVARAGTSVFVSTDRGDHWSEIALPAARGAARENCSVLVFAGERRLIAGTENGRVFRIDRPRAGWHAAKVTVLARPVAGYLSDLVLSGRTLWAATSRLGVRHVWRSGDGGRSWSDRSGDLPDVPVNALVVDPADARRVFAATDHGVFETRDGGATWHGFNDGLPNVIVGDLILHENERLLRAGTRSRGAWQAAI